MPVPLTASLPPDLQLEAGYVIRLTAIDPTTGAVVSGVALSGISFFVRDLGHPDGGDEAPTPLLVPAGGDGG